MQTCNLSKDTVLCSSFLRYHTDIIIHLAQLPHSTLTVRRTSQISSPIGPHTRRATANPGPKMRGRSARAAPSPQPPRRRGRRGERRSGRIRAARRRAWESRLLGFLRRAASAPRRLALSPGVVLGFAPRQRVTALLRREASVGSAGLEHCTPHSAVERGSVRCCVLGCVPHCRAWAR